MFTYEGLTLRTIEEGDLEPMRALRNDPTTWSMLTHVDMVEEDAQRTWFTRLRQGSDRRYYAIADSQHAFIGIVRSDEIDRANRSIRVGADILPSLRGRGYGYRTYRTLLKYCFDHLNMHRVWLLVLETNTPACALYSKCGFVVEGRQRQAIFRDGAYRDYIMMSILAPEFRR